MKNRIKSFFITGIFIIVLGIIYLLTVYDNLTKLIIAISIGAGGVISACAYAYHWICKHDQTHKNLEKQINDDICELKKNIQSLTNDVDNLENKLEELKK